MNDNDSDYEDQLVFNLTRVCEVLNEWCTENKSCVSESDELFISSGISFKKPNVILNYIINDNITELIVENTDLSNLYELKFYLNECHIIDISITLDDNFEENISLNGSDISFNQSISDIPYKFNEFSNVLKVKKISIVERNNSLILQNSDISKILESDEENIITTILIPVLLSSKNLNNKNANENCHIFYIFITKSKDSKDLITHTTNELFLFSNEIKYGLLSELKSFVKKKEKKNLLQFHWNDTNTSNIEKFEHLLCNEFKYLSTNLVKSETKEILIQIILSKLNEGISTTPLGPFPMCRLHYKNIEYVLTLFSYFEKHDTIEINCNLPKELQKLNIVEKNSNEEELTYLSISSLNNEMDLIPLNLSTVFEFIKENNEICKYNVIFNLFDTFVNNCKLNNQHSFKWEAEKVISEKDVFGFNLLEHFLARGLVEESIYLINDVGYCPEEKDNLEKDSFFWASTLTESKEIDFDSLLNCWSDNCVKVASKMLNTDNNFSTKLQIILNKFYITNNTITIDNINDELCKTIQNHLISNCWITSLLYPCLNIDETKDITFCDLNILVREDFYVILMLGNCKIEWKENNLITITNISCNDLNCFKIIPVYTFTNDNFKSVIHQMSEIICNWNGKMIFNRTNCNDCHFCIIILKRLNLWFSLNFEVRKILTQICCNKTQRLSLPKLGLLSEIPMVKLNSNCIDFLKREPHHISGEELKEMIRNIKLDINTNVVNYAPSFLDNLLFETDEYHFIAEGGFARIYKCYDKRVGNWKVLKIVSSTVEKNLELNACLMMKNIVSEFIVPIEEFIVKDDELYILMPFYPLGDLKTLLNNSSSISISIINQILEQLTIALKTLHNNNIIHRDIKLENIFVKDFNNSIIHTLLGDLGCGKLISDSSSDMEDLLFGSQRYLAPEVLEGNRWSLKSDLWSLGICIYQLITRELLVTSEDFIHIPQRKLLFEKLIDVPSTLLRSLHKLLEIDENKRTLVNEL
ncbi:hypothetical protein ABK040_012911 [Willaertia magna]